MNFATPRTVRILYLLAHSFSYPPPPFLGCLFLFFLLSSLLCFPLKIKGHSSTNHPYIRSAAPFLGNQIPVFRYYRQLLLFFCYFT